jgi:hypothetical protein
VADVDRAVLDFVAPLSLLAHQALETMDTKEKLLNFGVSSIGSNADNADLVADGFYLVRHPKMGKP